MKMRNKGKIHPPPSTSSSSSSSHSPNKNPSSLSILNLLPATILALASLLSLQDKEVLAYMITRSMKPTNPSSINSEKKKKNTKNTKPNTHKPPLFDCDCFDCYTSYWLRWDSSPNRELIHQAIEAFEENLSKGASLTSKGKNKRRGKVASAGNVEKVAVLTDVTVPEIGETSCFVVPERDDVESETGEVELKEVVGSLETTAVVVYGTAENINNSHHKGLVRKVLPDFVGLLNSRLWSLWNPNM